MSGVIRSKRLLALIVALVAGALVTGAVAYAAITSRQILAEGNGLSYQFVRTSADSFDSGWHVHPGLVVVQVEEGSFQFTQGSCTPKTVGAGETFIEVPWKPVRAVATGPIKWTTSILVPQGQPLSIPFSAYGSGQSPPCP
ncbi:MAG: hypothetical protein ABI783_00070 [Actinomycetota bacterium]